MSVILVGGNSRTPMVQAAVKGAVGAYVHYLKALHPFTPDAALCSDKIALNVNADEAPVLGRFLKSSKKR